MTDDVVSALLRALELAPDDRVLRLHVAELLIADRRTSEAIVHLGTLLAADPGHARALELMASALSNTPVVEATPAVEANPATAPTYDWAAAEEDVDGIVAPAFVEATPTASEEPAVEPEHPRLTLADVGGMEQVKERLTASFLAPLQNPELRRLYGKRLRGGLLLYGPPGCGKTHLARALAGELGASFVTIRLNDVLNMYLGESEQNLHRIFDDARRNAPCVVFLDEVDGIGQRRTGLGSSPMRGVVSQLLEELDGVATQAGNEGVYVLAATNQPWDVDVALRRPGRLDRTVLVLPPDREARAAIFHAHLRDRPIEAVDVVELARRTDGYSGADIAHICETASETALLDSVRSGEARLIQMDDLLTAIADVRPSVGDWLTSARNVALFGNADGQYDELKAYLKKVKRL
ncbi:AAA family ATPase [Microbacterium sp. B19]|uniref:AAA family ATPase n=1 Tax=Microbacterium sp. B19 TaxID=96765 RepID=UPI0003460D67|nr:AAA family ATPase [Microbacterium sp. B19]